MDMNSLEKNLLKNIDTLPEGCKYCIKGEKLVLFITGECDENCFYCPISEKRKGKDEIYANEKKISNLIECVNEVGLCDSKGVGITGGNPLLKIDRTCEYLKYLKNKFGDSFHSHLYTSPTYINEDNLKKLKDANLDEIRIHPTKYFNLKLDDNEKKKYIEYLKNRLKLAMKYIKDVGVEIPAIPNYEDEIIYLAEELNKIGVKFLNLNELEYSETNYKNLIDKGFYPKNDYSSSIKDSEETALKVVNYFKNKPNFKMIIHYCPSSLKDSIQMKNRLINRAKNVAKPYDIITDEGLILRGIMVFEGDNKSGMKDIVEILKDNNVDYEVSNNDIY